MILTIYCIWTGGGFLEADVHWLIDAMEEQETDIMIFALPYLERHFTKRDAFILMDCDTPAFTETKQRLARFDKDVLDRSPYKRVICLHRNKKMPKTYFIYKLCPMIWQERWMQRTWQKLYRQMYQSYCAVRDTIFKKV